MSEVSDLLSQHTKRCCIGIKNRICLIHNFITYISKPKPCTINKVTLEHPLHLQYSKFHPHYLKSRKKQLFLEKEGKYLTASGIFNASFSIRKV